MMKDPLRDCPMSRKGDILYTLCLAIILTPCASFYKAMA